MRLKRLDRISRIAVLVDTAVSNAVRVWCRKETQRRGFERTICCGLWANSGFNHHEKCEFCVEVFPPGNPACGESNVQAVRRYLRPFTSHWRAELMAVQQ